MSVPVPNRGHGELEVNTQARALTVYTLHILENEKWFPQKQQKYIEKLQDCVIEIQALCWEVYLIPDASKIKTWRKKYQRLVAKSKRGLVPRENVDMSFRSWIDHLNHGNSKQLIKRLTNYYNQLWEE